MHGLANFKLKKKKREVGLGYIDLQEWGQLPLGVCVLCTFIQNIQWLSGLLPGGKWLGRVDRPPQSRPKEIVELYLYSPSGPSRPVTGWTLPFSLHEVAPP